MAKILIVEDDKSLVSTIKDWLNFEHHIVEVAETGEDALSLLKITNYDLMILDISLPGINGDDVLRQFRADGGSTPVIMLTGRGELKDKEDGLDAGADDYMTKPFHLRELSARTRAILRRPRALLENVLQFKDIQMDSTSFRVYKGEEEVHLARMEFALLEFLIRHKGQVFSPEAILDRVWQTESERSPESLRTLIKKLRRKIDTAGDATLIQNVHGVGYRLADD
ncbi:MAG: response regulator transcription factor [Leptolyngbya sp.]|nr:response regulator transcription factor [Candidatus Melainabacteria bacterium]